MDQEFIIRTIAGVVLSIIVGAVFFTIIKEEFHPVLYQSLRFKRQLVFILPIFAVLLTVLLWIFVF